MKQLANNCRYSGVKVTPRSWKTSTSTKKNWVIYYRFYCPGLTGKGTQYPKGKLVLNRDMNILKDADKRRDFVRQTIIEIEKDLHELNYNPITGLRKEFTPEELARHLLEPDTPFIEAMQVAREKKKCTDSVKSDLAIVIRYITMAAKNLKIDRLPVNTIGRKHIRLILDQLEHIKPNTVINKKTGKTGSWNAYMFNFYRAHMSMLFEELCEWETIDNNPAQKIKKMKHITAKRVTMTSEERKLVDESLRKDCYPFWRFMHIFFHSGARIVEILKVKKEDVDLANQQVCYTILKGNEYRREYRPINDASLNLWEQALVTACKGQYVFSKNLKPGNDIINYRQIGRRWRRWVKSKHGIEADFYSLKHSHTTELAGMVGTKLAAMHNRHTERVLKSNYDVNSANRNMEILKKIDVPFA